ncbi:MAG: Fur family transcriptional regulator [Kiritimatiellia bacterium]|nr:Fur family transcriptional regulator [Kiritimatiellia bacterium]
MDEKKRMDEFMTQCRERHVRVTPQRVEIFRQLSRCAEHPAAETLYERVRETMPAISLDTVYRTLSLLEAKHLVCTVGTVDGRTRYDATTALHYHFICDRCRSVSDIFRGEDDTFDPSIVAAGMGDVDAVNIQLRGTCRNCLDRASA